MVELVENVALDIHGTSKGQLQVPVAEKVSSTIVSCDTATVTSRDSSIISSFSRTSADAVVSTHRSRTKTSKDDDAMIPRAITMTTSTNSSSSNSKKQPTYPSDSTASTLPTVRTYTNLSTEELFRQLQKRLRPEDIPSVPNLSLRNQRRRYDGNTVNALTKAGDIDRSRGIPTMSSASYHRPTCIFVNYMGKSQPSQTSVLAKSPLSPSYCQYYYQYQSRSTQVNFNTSLISLQDDIMIPTYPSCFGSSDDDLLLLSDLDTDSCDLGMIHAEDCITSTNDVLMDDSDEIDILSLIEPYRFSNSLPVVYGAAKVQHLNYADAATDTKEMLDSFNLICRDDVDDLFDFDL
jgi:hypothetical protein